MKKASMIPRTLRFCLLALFSGLTSTGCHPIQPFYFHEDGDLSHFLDVAYDIENPDVDTCSLPDASETRAPLTVLNRDFDEFWDLTLEQAISTTLQNSKVIRTVGFGGGGSLIQSAVGSFNGAMGAPTNLLQNPDFVQTVYEPAIQETDPNVGVEGALAAFDAQFAANLFWDRRDRPRNLSRDAGFFSNLDAQDLATSQAELSKRHAAGTQTAIRTRHQYDNLRARTAQQPLSTFWTTEWEAEIRHPLMRGGGVQVNRIPIVIARIQTDIRLADFEQAVRDMVLQVETSYWELAFCYRVLDAEKQGRDSALVTWKKIEALSGKLQGGEADKLAQARQQYFEFQGRVVAAYGELFRSENRLRFLMGLTASDGRLIRPVDEPTAALVRFEWHQILCESLTRSVELRSQKWRIKQREMELIAARNNLLPQFDATTLYRWVGVGDELISADRQPVSFPGIGSTSYQELTDGQYQEFRVGFEFGFPLGFRRELAGVRQSTLRLVRDKAVLQEMELEAGHQLADSIMSLDGNYMLTQTTLNTLDAANQEVEAVEVAYEAGTVTLDLLLDAQRRRSQAERSYFRALLSYNQNIAQIHSRKGSLLEYNNVSLAEGPWPEKAYWDATGHARRRDASTYMNFGFTRPRVISRGPVKQHQETVNSTGANPGTGSGEVLLPQKAPVKMQPLNPTNAPLVPQHEARERSFDWGNVGVELPHESPLLSRQ
ncbi:MAG: TolC family protein [Pirellulaceae bacterium]|nr:TolC family protein [Pirellulaceae bacterium]